MLPPPRPAHSFPGNFVSTQRTGACLLALASWLGTRRVWRIPAGFSTTRGPPHTLKKMTMRKMTARDGHSSGLQNRRPGSVSAFAKTRYTPSCTSLSLPPKKLEFIIRGLRPKLLNKMEFLLKTTKTHHLVYLFYLFWAAASQEPPSSGPEGGAVVGGGAGMRGASSEMAATSTNGWLCWNQQALGDLFCLFSHSEVCMMACF